MLESRYMVQAFNSGLLSDVTKALLSGFYMQIAVRTDDGKYFRLKDNMEVKLHPSSVISRNDPSAKWIMFDELVRNRTPFVRTASVISPQLLFEVAPEYYNPEAFPNE
ncbi:hypothetical protein APHAL10511_006920 [Amanita phalloides]|nr:hypothetical protein APHAL10511_006920 [Amanita phalloides]